MNNFEMMSFIKRIVKYFLVILLVLVVEIVLLWIIPFKQGIKEKDFNINNYVQKYGDVAIRANDINATLYNWDVIEYAGIDNCPRDIAIEGNVPDDWLKTQVDDFYDVDFLFIGKFDEEDSHVFIVEKWYTVGKIERPMNIMWYPPYGLNIFEHDFD